MRREHFAIADGSLHEALGTVDLADATGAVDPEPAESVQTLGARTLRLLRGLSRRPRRTTTTQMQTRTTSADKDVDHDR